MTRVNEYLWLLPHEAGADDPPEVRALVEAFSQPFIDLLSEPMAERGYRLSDCDVMVKLDERLDDTLDTFYANVRFVKYLTPNILTRVHFQHVEWAFFWPEPDVHRFFINLDRFKTVDPNTKQAVPAWEGRLHTRLSILPGALFFEDEDQVWSYASSTDLDQRLALFADKFEGLVIPWLEDLSGID